MPRKSPPKPKTGTTKMAIPIDWEVLAALTAEFVDRHICQFDPEFLKGSIGMISIASGMRTPLTYSISPREEANALIADCVRNSVLENFHASGVAIGQKEMKALMIDSSRKLCQWVLFGRLTINTKFEPIYHASLFAIGRLYCRNWEV